MTLNIKSKLIQSWNLVPFTLLKGKDFPVFIALLQIKHYKFFSTWKSNIPPLKIIVSYYVNQILDDLKKYFNPKKQSCSGLHLCLIHFIVTLGK